MDACLQLELPLGPGRVPAPVLSLVSGTKRPVRGACADSPDLARRRDRGSRAYLSGLAAEEATARDYERRGRQIAARRWRGQGGEIDLIAREGDEVVFVEVKQARTHDLAAERLSPRQVGRLFDAALEFLAGEPLGQGTYCRFDVALVDGIGRVKIIENALAA